MEEYWKHPRKSSRVHIVEKAKAKAGRVSSYRPENSSKKVAKATRLGAVQQERRQQKLSRRKANKANKIKKVSHTLESPGSPGTFCAGNQLKLTET